MAEDRPRPQFGEYASPEQQAAAMGKRPIPPLRVQPEMPEPVRASAADGTPAPDPADRVVSRRLPRHHPVDRIATLVLLGLGLFSLLNAVPSYFAFGKALERFTRALDETYTAPAVAAQAGYVLFATQIVLFLLALGLSVRRVRAGKLAFWIPLVAWVVFDLAAAVIVSAMVPSFVTVFQSYAAIHP
jgi:hypothetical protein